MAKSNTRKKLSKKKFQQRQKLIKQTIISVLLCLLVISISYMIFKTNILQPSVNEVTASYISFNNNDNTDEIKINNIKKMSNEIGKSIANTKYNKLLITGEKNTNYELVIYQITNNIDLEYINIAITIGNKTYITNLKEAINSDDGGIVIYKGSVKEEKELTIRMWVNKKYSEKVKDNSFRIKIRQK